MADNKASSKPELNILERYRRILYIVGFCAKICGANVADADFRVCWYTYAVSAIILNYFACTFYTIYIDITNDGDITKLLQTCCFFGGGLQGSVKFFSFLAYREKVLEMQRFLDNTFFTYDAQGERYRDALSKALLKTMRFFKLSMAMNIGLFVTCWSVPMFYYLIYKEKIMIMQFLLPGLNPNTNTGYFILTVLHFASMSVGVFGSFAADMYLLIYVGNISLFKDILGCKFDDLIDLLDREIKPTKAELHSSILKVVVWHQDYLRLLDTANSMFFLIIFAYVFGCAVGIMTTSYCMLVGAWPVAPFLMIYSYINLYAYCGLGTLVDISNEDCTKLIYTRCRWYELPVREQRYILLMLRVSQTSSGLTVGHMMPLNVATGLQLTKALFSMVMFLLSTEDDVRDAK